MDSPRKGEDRALAQSEPDNSIGARPMPAQPITTAEYQTRLKHARAAMAASGLDALVAYANKTHPGHVRYLSGYETRLGIHDSALCVVTPERCALLTNASFDQPRTQTWLEEVVVTADYADAIA